MEESSQSTEENTGVLRRNMVRLKHITILIVSLFMAFPAFARPPEEAEFMAAGHLGEDIASWIDGLEENRPNSLGIFSVHTNLPLEQDFSILVENEIIKSLSHRGLEKVTSCAECRIPSVTVQDDKVIVSR